VLKLKKKPPHYILAAAVIVKNGRVLLAKRPSKGLLGGMWEFPNGRVEDDPGQELSKSLRSGYQLKVRRNDALGVVRHAYTHFKVTVHVFQCKFVSKTENQNLRWIKLKNLEDFPMGKVDRQITKLFH
jgi:A/G-specific adenine glycosylase